MPDLKHLINQHGHMVAYFTDGSKAYLTPSTGGLWVAKQGGNTNPPTPPPGPGSEPWEGTGLVTPEMVSAAVTSVGGSISAMLRTPEQIAEMFNQAIAKLEPNSFNTKARLACLVGECAQETGWFRSWEEFDQGAGRDYVPYWGRGFIQLTHKGNYLAFGQYCKSKGLIDNEALFVENRDLLLTDEWAARTAIFYFTQTSWSGANLCQWCDDCEGSQTGNWYQISRAINRGSPYNPNPAYDEELRNIAINAVLTVTKDPNPGPDSSLGARAVAYGMSVIRRFYYTQSDDRLDMLATGGGDCSSFVVLCYTQGCGMTNEQMGGSGRYPGYTGTLATIPGVIINDTGDENGMLPGDWMLCTYEGYNPTFDHVVLYIGNGQCLSHGGGQGPNIESYTWYLQNSSHRLVRGFR